MAVTTSPAWVAKATIPYADQDYKDGDRPDFSLAVQRTFDSGITGQSAQSEFDGSSSTDSTYDDTNPFNGTEYVNLHAEAGEEVTFKWGGILGLPTDLVEGQEIWVQVMIRPEEAFWTDSNPFLKFLRVREEGSGFNDVYLNRTTGEVQYIKEGVGVWYYPTLSGRVPSINAWNRYEFYIKFSTDPLVGHTRVWKDNELLIDAANQTLEFSSGTITDFYLFTYWNPAAPTISHDVGCENIKIATSASPPVQTDVGGNIFIGTSFDNEVSP